MPGHACTITAQNYACVKVGLTVTLTNTTIVLGPRAVMADDAFVILMSPARSMSSE